MAACLAGREGGGDGGGGGGGMARPGSPGRLPRLPRRMCAGPRWGGGRAGPGRPLLLAALGPAGSLGQPAAGRGPSAGPGGLSTHPRAPAPPPVPDMAASRELLGPGGSRGSGQRCDPARSPARALRDQGRGTPLSVAPGPAPARPDPAPHVGWNRAALSGEERDPRLPAEAERSLW